MDSFCSAAARAARAAAVGVLHRFRERAKVPFAENPGRVTGVAKKVRHGRQLRAQQGAAAADIDCPVAGGIEAGQQLPARRRAHRRHMIIGQTQALPVQPVEVRRIHRGIPVDG